MILSGVLVLIIAVLTFMLLKVGRDLKALNLYLKRLINIVSQARYGNLKVKITPGNDEITRTLTDAINAMFESISDRDAMIQEYITKEKESNILKTDFIATLTHDLKVPIIAQDKTFDLLLDEKFGSLDDTQKQAIQNLKISNMDLRYLVEALLETYKIEQTKIELNPEHCAIVHKTREIIEQIEPVALAHNKKINLYVHVDENFMADLDVFLFKRVLQNLILNALTHSQNSDCVDVSITADEDNFTVHIKDYGVGIDKGEIKKVFNKYYRGTSKFMKSGVGLGLYLSNRIVMAHQGKIDVESKTGEGSTFSIILPKKIILIKIAP